MRNKAIWRPVGVKEGGMFFFFPPNDGEIKKNFVPYIHSISQFLSQSEKLSLLLRVWFTQNNSICVFVIVF